MVSSGPGMQTAVPLRVVMRRMTTLLPLCHSFSLSNRKLNHSMTGGFVFKGLGFSLLFILRVLFLDGLLVTDTLFI